MDEAADVAPENGRRGRAAGTRNYRNDLLIPIVEGILPQGAEGWRLVAASYKTASGEPDLRDHEALRENWVKKLCNNFKKPTGRTGENGDRIARCIEIERRIQEAANAAILGCRPQNRSTKTRMKMTTLKLSAAVFVPANLE